ncbi:MAG: helix-turn-helix domain-containing protein [Ignavibacteriales bacterium]|nr:helix-turn-helix domain-containing protein [Ignavibacteriales bacterium]
MYVTGVFFAFCLFYQIPDDVIHIPYKNEEIKVDGVLDDWEDAFDYVFTDTLRSFYTVPEIKLNHVYPSQFDFAYLKKPLSKNTAKVKYFWNLKSLNIAILVKDEQLFAQIDTGTDKPKLHLNDGIEIYIDSKCDDGLKMNTNDYQFIVDLKNRTQVFRGDRRLIKLDTLAVPKDYDQNVLFKSKLKYFGTVNQPEDIDSFYIVEISIPFASIGFEPQSGKSLRMDICCNDIDYPIEQGTIIEYASTIMWSFDWMGYSDFGFPKYWRKVKLIGGPSFLENLAEEYKQYWLWVYLITFALTFSIITYLYLRIKRISKIPSESEVNKGRIIFIPFNEQIKNKLTTNQIILQKASKYIIDNKHRTIHSEEVAKEIGISLRHFQRLTREELNTTPTNFIYLVKLKLAEEFLICKLGNITEAAFEFGFNDLSHFSKLFKNHFGLSPSDYIKQNINT